MHSPFVCGNRSCIKVDLAGGTRLSTVFDEGPKLWRR